MHINLTTKPAQIAHLPKYFSDKVSVEAEFDEDIALGTWRRCTEGLAQLIEEKLELKVIRGEDPDIERHEQLISAIREHAEDPQDDPVAVTKWAARKRKVEGWDDWLANCLPSASSASTAPGCPLLSEVADVMSDASVVTVAPSQSNGGESPQSPKESPAESPTGIARGPAPW